ncbi:DNA cytosine methyltransferase [Streptosporangium amethystogenes]|uniref:DNA cytosine methyltransferase n=1 Tax=Streptosporangium amethystogenes TaxID=2002 RepID=UPI00378C10C4
MLKSLEICAGAGGQALGLEQAGFEPVMLIDNDPNACATLRTNRPHWDVQQLDLHDFVASDHPQVLDVDLMACGVPCTPFSIAGMQQGTEDERDLLKVAIWLAHEVQPKAILIENVPALLKESKFARSRDFVKEELGHLGYWLHWDLLNAQDFGVAQRRPHSVLVALRKEYYDHFQWPCPTDFPLTVGEVLQASMASRGWEGASAWAKGANTIAPTIVGGSRKHGGADLGPSRTKAAWAKLGVNGSSLADEVPGPDFVLEHGVGPKGWLGFPKLTVRQVAYLQGFPDDWIFCGRKTASYRQVAQTFPPPVATAVGEQIKRALSR